MAVDKPHLYEPGIYFVTFTNYNWLPLFEITQSYDLVYKWFDVLKSLGHSVTSYVIMPNHVHALIGFVPGDKSINTIVGNGKRFMAYDIVGRLKAAGCTDILTKLAEGVNVSDRAKGALHEVFRESFDAKLCRTYKFVTQKMNYIHGNPVSKKWRLVEYAGDYVHSSAGYYETRMQGIYPVMPVEDVIEQLWYGRPGSEK